MLTELNIPPHTHTGDASSMSATLKGHTAGDADVDQPGPGAVLSKKESPIVVNAYSDSDANLVEIGGAPSLSVISAGSHNEHENRQPLLAVNYIIALVGIFPSRD